MVGRYRKRAQGDTQNITSRIKMELGTALCKPTNEHPARVNAFMCYVFSAFILQTFVCPRFVAHVVVFYSSIGPFDWYHPVSLIVEAW